jgi:hypothetical protein
MFGESKLSSPNPHLPSVRLRGVVKIATLSTPENVSSCYTVNNHSVQFNFGFALHGKLKTPSINGAAFLPIQLSCLGTAEIPANGLGLLTFFVLPKSSTIWLSVNRVVFMS